MAYNQGNFTGGGSRATSSSAAAREKIKVARQEIALRRWESALDNLNDAVVIDSKLPECFVLRSRVFYVLGQSENAINDADRAIKLAENNPDVLLQLAHLHMAEGLYGDALDVARAGLLVDTSHEGLKHIEAVLLFSSNDFRDAASRAVELLGSADTTPDVLGSAATIFASSVEALGAMGDQEALRQLGSAFPEDEEPGRPTRDIFEFDALSTADHLVDLGGKHFDRGGAANMERTRYLWESARLIYAVSGEQERANVTINKLAHVYTALGRPDRAKAALASRHRSGKTVDTAMAMQQFRTGNYNAAIELFEAELKIADKLDFVTVAELHLNLGEVYVEASSLPEATANFEKSSERASQAGEEGTEIRLRALNELAKCQILRREFPAAREALLEAKNLHSDVYRKMGVMNGTDTTRQKFIQYVRTTHATIGELCLAKSDFAAAFEWFERARSFGLIDELGESVARDGMSDIVMSEAVEKLRETGVDACLSFFKTSATQLHAFLVFVNSTGEPEVQYKAVTWAPHMRVDAAHVCEELQRLGGELFGDMAASIDMGGSATLAMSSSVLGPKRSLRFRASTKAVEQQMEQAEKRTRIAEAEAEKRRDKVRDEDRVAVHHLFMSLIAPFRPAFEKVVALGRPIRTVVSCDDALFDAPWSALHDPHTDQPISATFNIVAVTTCVAQFRWCTWKRSSISSSSVNLAVVRDSTIPAGDRVLESSSAVDIVVNERSLDRDFALPRDKVDGCNAVHIALRYSNADIVAKDRSKREVDNIFGDDYVVVGFDAADLTDESQRELAQKIMARHCVGDTGASALWNSDSGYLFALKEAKGIAPLTSNGVDIPVASKRYSIPVDKLTSRLKLPNCVVTLDLEGGPKDCTIKDPRLIRNILAAGAHAVIVPQWRVSNNARALFFTSFYAALREGLSLFEAVDSAREVLEGAEPVEEIMCTDAEGIAIRDARDPKSSVVRGAFVVYM